jgi:hypothetical protein
VQDADGMLVGKVKEHGEEGEREILPEKRICQRRSGKIKSKGKMMNIELSEKDKDTDKQERRERIKESRYNRNYSRGNSGVPVERECKRNKNDGETQMWERGERKKSIGREERKKGAECATRREKTMTHVEWM